MEIDIPTFRYNGSRNPVLHDIHLYFQGPQLLALLGPNGSGKSSLLKLAAGLMAPAEGGCRVGGGAPVHRLSRREAARRIAWVPQRAEVPFAMTVAEMLEVGAYRWRRPFGPLPFDAEERIERALVEVGLDGLEAREAATLSGGEWQRALIARALVQDSPVLLLDEPVASLDLRHQDEIYRLLVRLARSDRLVLVADHHLELAAAHADRLLLLESGRIVFQGPPRDALTSERVLEVFGVRVEVFRDPVTGTPRLSLPESGE